MINDKLKRVIAIHDISCFGKCSLTVALPILSACGVECTCLPTAVLSTHTGGFTGFTYRDLTDDLEPIAKHWKEIGLKFDGIYTGYLGSFRQIDIVKEYIDSFCPDKKGLVLVDPVMADNGVMYPLFDKKFAKGMGTLCERADIIIPNVTEASFLLEEEYPKVQDKACIDGLLKRLSDRFCDKVVLTGVKFEEGKIGAACFDKVTGKYSYYFNDYVEGYFHGTGDVFSSALLGAVLNGFELEKAIAVAVDFTLESIKRTNAEGTDSRFGVDFERSLVNLIKSISDGKNK